MSESLPRTRFLTIVAQDPSVKDPGKIGTGRSILTEKIEIPAEDLSPGPYGYRIHVVDYDSSTGTHYKPLVYPELDFSGKYPDPFGNITDDEILNNPRFHAQNVYAIVMKTLARFEFALGRRIAWGFPGHQIYIAPHAFADANAFYSEQDRALMFGYFSSSRDETQDRVFSCLSHDVVAHEATHAILDGLRKRYTTPTSAEQAGFHEGFADVVALLSVFGLRRVIGLMLENLATDDEKDEMEHKNDDLIRTDKLTEEKLKNSPIFGLADQMGEEMFGRGKALRRSVTLATLAEGDSYLGRGEFNEPHRCGELFVAAIMNSFLKIWTKRIAELKGGENEKEYLDRSLVVDQGAGAANTLLTMVIRAIDYTPPTDITFSDYLTALLTADREAVPDDSRYHYRDVLKQSFKMYGVEPLNGGYWDAPKGNFNYDRVRFDSLLRDPDEVFRFIWDNRNEFESVRGKRLYEEKAYTRVQSVRPSLKIGPDGFAVRETVAEYVQIVNVKAAELELEQYDGIDKPADMPDSTEITLYGGGTLVFDEYGKLKYHINNRVFSQKKQTCRLQYLWDCGFYSDPDYTKNAFSKMHLRRASIFPYNSTEEGFD